MVMDGGDGLGNLADELAEAWDGEEEEERDPRPLYETLDGHANEANGHITPPQIRSPSSASNHVLSSPVQQDMSSLSPTKSASRPRHRRQTVSQYDGSDYGSDPEEVDGMSPSLEARMAAVEHLARRGTEANGSEADTVISRVADSLRDLRSQSRVENGASRLITAHTSLSTHLTHQTRLVTSTTQSLFSPIAPPPEPSDIDLLLNIIPPLLSSIPTPEPRCPLLLHALASSTSDVIHTLSTLSDTLHMTRQTSQSASRRLQSTKALMVELRKEQNLAEEGRRWVETGSWDRRLEEREGRKICGEVVGGFEDVCKGWREKLISNSGVEVVAG